MSEKLAKYIVTTGKFDDETNNKRQASKKLKYHAKLMKESYGGNDTYGLYMLIETYRVD